MSKGKAGRPPADMTPNKARDMWTFRSKELQLMIEDWDNKHRAYTASQTEIRAKRTELESLVVAPLDIQAKMAQIRLHSEIQQLEKASGRLKRTDIQAEQKTRARADYELRQGLMRGTISPG